jgi:hypothetical protein
MAVGSACYDLGPQPGLMTDTGYSPENPAPILKNIMTNVYDFAIMNKVGKDWNQEERDHLLQQPPGVSEEPTSDPAPEASKSPPVKTVILFPLFEHWTVTDKDCADTNLGKYVAIRLPRECMENKELAIRYIQKMILIIQKGLYPEVVTPEDAEGMVSLAIKFGNFGGHPAKTTRSAFQCT